MTEIKALLSKLTLEEKVAQLQGLLLPYLFDTSAPADGQAAGPVVDLGRLDRLRPHGLGHLSMAWFAKSDAPTLRRTLADIQERSRQISRFGIGALVHGEGINGLVHSTGIQFPTAWAQAATWMPDLVESSAAITAQQMRDLGFQICFSPVLDVSRDPRWGRVHETYGEDTELVSRIGVSFIRGINGANLDSGVQATGKHFLGYGVSEGGHNQAKSSIGRRELTDQYAEPFRRVIKEAGLSIVMNSYNEIDGVPAAANRWLLEDLLRGELGFDGLVVSDYDAIKMLLTPFHVARDEQDAAVMAISAGMDVELPGDDTFSKLVSAVEGGVISEEILDQATARVLKVKQAAGLLPGLAPSRPLAPAIEPDLPRATELAREIAINAATLLKNDGTLPLKPGLRVTVLGELTDELRIHFGAYTDVSNDEQPMAINMIRTGQVPSIDPNSFNFTDIFQARIPGIAPTFEAIARGLYPEQPTLIEALRMRGDLDVVFVNTGGPDAIGDIDRDTVAAAIADADTILVVVGERTGWLGNNSAGEGQTSARIELPGNQPQLVAAVRDAAVPVVSVVISGRPLILTELDEVSDAVLLAPLLGAHGPAVIADALVGAVEPGGRLPSTFPRHVGQIPLFHGHSYGSGYGHPTGKRYPYNDLDSRPLYVFGHGLGYTEFDIELVDASCADQQMTCRYRVTNTGARAGSTVVQVYVRDEHGSIVRPVRQLAAFQRESLAPGETVETTLTWPVERLFYTMANGTRGVEAGEVTVMLGLSSDNILATKGLTIDAATARQELGA